MGGYTGMFCINRKWTVVFSSLSMSVVGSLTDKIYFGATGQPPLFFLLLFFTVFLMIEETAQHLCFWMLYRCPLWIWQRGHIASVFRCFHTTNLVLVSISIYSKKMLKECNRKLYRQHGETNTWSVGRTCILSRRSSGYDFLDLRPFMVTSPSSINVLRKSL